ncbi:MAG TPA: choice-of-anchor D domain-containing protein [Granulicella sp.]
MRLTQDSRWSRRWRLVWFSLALTALGHACGQTTASPQARASRFLSGRVRATGAMPQARRQHAAMVAAQAVVAEDAGISLGASWQPVGPGQIASALYGKVTGRVTAVAVDPADASGNTVYVGTTGGGVWKSTNAAGPASAVSFIPLTDTISAFSPNAGTAAVPSLSIGAVSVQNGVVLAGTGDPNDATDSYYGGGVLRSEDGGVTWALIQQADVGNALVGTHSFVGLGVAGFAWSSDSSVVVMAVADAAEGELTQAAATTNSVRGLYVSTDGGKNWQMATIKDGGQTVQTPLPSGGNLGGNAATAVVWNPVRQRFYAAVRYHGYYESSDGATWTRLAAQPGGLSCPTITSAACPMARGALAVQPVSGDLFALTVDSGNHDQGLWQDVCNDAGSGCSGAVSFGTQLNSTPLDEGGGSTVIPQGDYNLALSAAASGNDTLLFVGTADLYRCSLGAGCTLRNTTNARNACGAPAGVAGAQHAIATLTTGALPLVYLGNDGGLWRSTDGVNETGAPCSADDASHFDNLNGGLGSLAEVISFAEDPTDANTLLAGFGANGSAGTSAAGSATEWLQLAPGEGGTVAIDPADTRNWYLSTAAGVSIGRCTQGGRCTAADFAGVPEIGLAQVSGDASLIDPPWLLDPALTSNLLAGTCRVWRGPAANGGAWSSANAVSTLLAGAQNAACDGTNPMIRSLAAGGAASGPGTGSTVLYAGMAGSADGGGSAGGHVFVTTEADRASSSAVWTDQTGSPVTNGAQGFNPGGFDVSSIVADAHDLAGQTVYATIMGFNYPHVYRSIDAGAHWTNISSNLPNAPANSVLVDPNDAHTVYVATDTGVYATGSVADCAVANCWSVYGAGLPYAPVVQLAASAALPTGDGRFGELRAATYGRGIWQVPLTTAYALQAGMSLSATSLSFGPQSVGTVSAAQTVTITNNGHAPLTVSSVAITGGLGTPTLPAEPDFAATTDSCSGATVPVGGSCAVEVSFLPVATGARPGVLTLYGNVSGGQASVTLTGTGTPPGAVVLTPLSLSFPATLVGAVSAAQNITVANTGGAVVTLGAPAVTGDYRIVTNTCAATLSAATSCTVAIAFAPTATGARAGSFTLTDSAGTQTASLRGNGSAPATDALSPASLSFAAQQLSTASGPQAVTLTNSGDVPLTLIAASITGDFVVTNACGNSLNAHASCVMQISYVPKNVGAESGVLTVSDQYRSQTVALAGFGVAPPGVSLAPVSALGFAPVGVGLSSAAQVVTLTNNGGQPLAISSVSLTGDFSLVPGSNTCGSAVAANSACTMQVVFSPAMAGIRTGQLIVMDNSAGSPQTLALTGTGVDFTLAAESSTQTVSSGASAVYPLLLTSASGVPGTAVFTCTGAPANATCNVTPSSVALGTGTAVVTVTVQTGVSTSAVTERGLAWLAVLLPVVLLPGRRRWHSRVLGLVVLCGLMGAMGCGSSRLIPGSSVNNSAPSTPTPGGASTVVVSASSAGLVRSVNLSLTVQ